MTYPLSGDCSTTELRGNIHCLEDTLACKTPNNSTGMPLLVGSVSSKQWWTGWDSNPRTPIKSRVLKPPQLPVHVSFVAFFCVTFSFHLTFRCLWCAGLDSNQRCDYRGGVTVHWFKPLTHLHIICCMPRAHLLSSSRFRILYTGCRSLPVQHSFGRAYGFRTRFSALKGRRPSPRSPMPQTLVM